MAGKERNTQQPTGGKGALFHTKKQIISKGELPKRKGAGGICVHEAVKTINKAGPSVPLIKRNRRCPSSGLSEQYIEMDDSTSFSTEMRPMDDFIEMDDFTSSNTEMFGSMLDGQSPTLGGEEAIVNESPHYKMPVEDFIEMDDFASFNTELMPMDDFIELDDCTSFSTEMVQWEDYNDQSTLLHQYYSLNKLENKIIKLNKDHSN